MVGLVGWCVAAYFVPALLRPGKLLTVVWAGFTLLDSWLLFRAPRGLHASRDTGARFSNGDDNPVHLTLENRYPFPVTVEILDEVPAQFQMRDLRYRLHLGSGASRTLRYTLRPVTRGVYNFGALNAYVSGPLRLVTRRYRFEASKDVAVYPSFIQMHRYALLAVSARLTEAGIKRVRRVGHTMEFDRIREYVVGDDYRTLNWKATARRHAFMVNEYEDAKAQPVYNLIDMGRVMKMPFNGMSLLDYAINATLVISNVAVRKHDKAGLVAFSDRIHAMLPADRRPVQLHEMLEVLYRLQTQYPESNYERLYAAVRHRIRQRGLLLLYTNFETLASMKRQLPYLRPLARRHLLVAIFFENTELRRLLERRCHTVEDVYLKTIAEKFAFEKRLIVKALNRHGIHAVLTPPEELSVRTINKYLELKALGRI